MTNEQQIALINAEYNSESGGKVYPFISNTRITVLKKGLYQKKNSNYRGIGIIKDSITGKDKTVLMGYYNVSYDMVIIPLDFELDSSIKALISRYKEDNFIICDNGFPQLPIIEFNEESLEHKVAVKRKQDYNTKIKNYDSLNNS